MLARRLFLVAYKTIHLSNMLVHFRNGSAETIARAATQSSELQTKVAISPSNSSARPTSPCTDPLKPGACQGSHMSNKFMYRSTEELLGAREGRGDLEGMRRGCREKSPVSRSRCIPISSGCRDGSITSRLPRLTFYHLAIEIDPLPPGYRGGPLTT